MAILQPTDGDFQPPAVPSGILELKQNKIVYSVKMRYFDVTWCRFSSANLY